MREKITSLLRSGVSRKALMAAGAVVGAGLTFYGIIIPDGVNIIHDIFQLASAKNPFGNPVEMISSLYDGAKFQAASAVQTVGSFLRENGIEMSQQIRDAIKESKEFLGPLAGQAKSFFMAHSDQMGAKIGEIAQSIQDAAEDPARAREIARNVADKGVEIIRTAAEAFGVYEFMKRGYQKVFSRGRAQIEEEMTRAGEAPNEQTVNLNLNISVAGAPAADAAMRVSKEIRIKKGEDPTLGLSSLSPEKIVILTDRFNRAITNELSTFMTEVDKDRSDRKIKRISLVTPPVERFEDSLNPMQDLKHRARFPMINWDESPLSKTRLEERSKSRVSIPSSLREEIGLAANSRIRMSDSGVITIEQPALVAGDRDLYPGMN